MQARRIHETPGPDVSGHCTADMIPRAGRLWQLPAARMQQAPLNRKRRMEADMPRPPPVGIGRAFLQKREGVLWRRSSISAGHSLRSRWSGIVPGYSFAVWSPDQVSSLCRLPEHRPWNVCSVERVIPNRWKEGVPHPGLNRTVWVPRGSTVAWQKIKGLKR